jgi:hypothetical protein
MARLHFLGTVSVWAGLDERVLNASGRKDF